MPLLFGRMVDATSDTGGSRDARLRRAAGRGEVDRMRDYAARGCDARGSDGLGFTALHCAAQHDQGDALAVLLGTVSEQVTGPL